LPAQSGNFLSQNVHKDFGVGVEVEKILGPFSDLPGNFLFREFSGISKLLEENFKKKKIR
jgi:hypothetical protein